MFILSLSTHILTNNDCCFCWSLGKGLVVPTIKCLDYFSDLYNLIVTVLFVFGQVK